MPSELSSDTLSNLLGDVEMSLVECLVGSAPGIMCMCKQLGDNNGMAVLGAGRRKAKRSGIGVGGDESM